MHWEYIYKERHYFHLIFYLYREISFDSGSNSYASLAVISVSQILIRSLLEVSFFTCKAGQAKRHDFQAISLDLFKVRIVTDNLNLILKEISSLKAQFLLLQRLLRLGKWYSCVNAAQCRFQLASTSSIPFLDSIFTLQIWYIVHNSTYLLPSSPQMLRPYILFE